MATSEKDIKHTVSDVETGLRVYTFKKEKTIDNWLFHPTYFTESTNFLPMSIQRELVKRLTTNRRNRIDPNKLKDLNPIIEVKLSNISNAYRNKQALSRKASKQRRIKVDTLEIAPSVQHPELQAILSDFRLKIRVKK
jgi:hypothetical protein